MSTSPGWSREQALSILPDIHFPVGGLVETTVPSESPGKYHIVPASAVRPDVG